MQRNFYMNNWLNLLCLTKYVGLQYSLKLRSINWWFCPIRQARSIRSWSSSQPHGQFPPLTRIKKLGRPKLIHWKILRVIYRLRTNNGKKRHKIKLLDLKTRSDIGLRVVRLHYKQWCIGGVYAGIRRIPTSGFFWQRILISAIINKHGTFRPFVTPVCVYPPPFLAIHPWK